MKLRTRAALLSVDLVIVLASFSIAVWIKQAPARSYFIDYAPALAIFTFLWLVITRYSRKFDSKRFIRLLEMNKRITTIFLSTMGELVVAYFHFTTT